MTGSGRIRPAVSTDLRDALRGVRALVLDADGVLLFAGKPLPQAVDALRRLHAAAIPYRVVTNFSSAHRRTLAAGFSRGSGLPVNPGQIITAASSAAAHTARRYPGRPLLVLASADALLEWEGQRVLTPDQTDAPDAGVAAVVIGDAGDDLSFRNLDLAFRAVRAGAELVAMHRNPWWVTERGVTLDAGAVVAGLEYALGQRATVAGKPSRVVFREAVRSMAVEAGKPALRARDVAMVGDDLETDVGGAHRAGLRGVLVLTGKTDAAAMAAAEASGRMLGVRRPDGVGASLLDVVAALLESRA